VLFCTKEGHCAVMILKAGWLAVVMLVWGGVFVLRHDAACGRVLQHIAVCCSVSQSTATFGSARQCVGFLAVVDLKWKGFVLVCSAVWGLEQGSWLVFGLMCGIFVCW